MSFNVTEIKNLTDGTVIYTAEASSPPSEGSKPSLKITSESFTGTIEFTSEKTTAWDLVDKNIQVKWNDGKEKRAAGGRWAYDPETKKGTITGLIDHSTILVSLQGTLNIGANSKVYVKVGNDNEFNDKIIDLSAGGKTEIHLDELIRWNEKQTGSKTELPADIKPEKFVLEVHAFRFNITRKTFNIDIRSQTGANSSKYTIADGFVLEDLGFILTNEKKQSGMGLPQPSNDQKLNASPPNGDAEDQG